ncbi:hypothetical protein OAJ57_00100 [Alphaproteobacteria bacterium]|nr:hypothetical protein [Alphaproteobacteria bacterium]
MNLFKIIVFVSALGMVNLPTASPTTAAEEVANFFKEKVITIYVGFERASGHDLYSRVLARHFGRHIPGKPTVRTENSPGDDSMMLANLVHNRLPQDGTVIASIGAGTATTPLLGNKQARFNGSRFNWLGSMNNEVGVCAFWHTIPIKFWQDLIDRGATVGGTGAGSDGHVSALVLNNILGTKLALVTGYPNDSYVNHAIERGELDGRCGWALSSLNSSSEKWLKEKKIKILVQLSMKRHSALQNVPSIMDFAKSRLDVQVLKLIYARGLWGRPYLVGPEVPRARVVALRDAFKKTLTDERFLADAKAHKLDLAWSDGARVQRAIAELYGLPKVAVAAALKALSNRLNIEMSRAVIPIETASGEITALHGGDRRISWAGDGNNGKIGVSRDRTKIFIAGEKATHGDLKLGMICKFSYRASTARKIYCQ